MLSKKKYGILLRVLKHWNVSMEALLDALDFENEAQFKTAISTKKLGFTDALKKIFEIGDRFNWN